MLSSVCVLLMLAEKQTVSCGFLTSVSGGRRALMKEEKFEFTAAPQSPADLQSDLLRSSLTQCRQERGDARDQTANSRPADMSCESKTHQHMGCCLLNGHGVWQKT